MVDRAGLARASFNSHEQIFAVGQAGDCAYLIESGAVNIISGSGDRVVVLDSLTAGDIFGEMALLDDKPRSASAIATKATNCVLITKTDFKTHFNNADPFTRAMLKKPPRRLTIGSPRRPDVARS